MINVIYKASSAENHNPKAHTKTKKNKNKNKQTNIEY